MITNEQEPKILSCKEMISLVDMTSHSFDSLIQRCAEIKTRAQELLKNNEAFRLTLNLKPNVSNDEQMFNDDLSIVASNEEIQQSLYEPKFSNLMNVLSSTIVPNESLDNSIIIIESANDATNPTLTDNNTSQIS